VPRFRPIISADLPDGWFAKESITLLAPDGQANVIASSEPLDESIDTDAYAAVQGDLLEKEFPGFDEYTIEDSEVFGRGTGLLRRFEWVPPDGVPVMQIQLYYAESGRGYTATATTPSSQFSRYELELTRILESLLIESLQAA
jgi:hypothetical protein